MYQSPSAPDFILAGSLGWERSGGGRGGTDAPYAPLNMRRISTIVIAVTLSFTTLILIALSVNPSSRVKGPLSSRVSTRILPRELRCHIHFNISQKALILICSHICVVVAILRGHGPFATPDRIQAPSVFARHCEIGLRHSEQPVRE